MPISRTSAQRLCTKPEFELVEASFPARVKELTPGRLRQKVARARKLRDKYRDLSKRQRLEARGKRAPQRSRPAQGHENTDRKAELFQETLERFETQLRRTGATSAQDEEAKTAGAKKGSAKKGGAKKGGAKKGGAKKGGAKKGGAKKGGARKAGPEKADAAARPAKPARAGAPAMKGGRQNIVRGPADAGVRARGSTARSHARSSQRRGQMSRDRRN